MADIRSDEILSLLDEHELSYSIDRDGQIIFGSEEDYFIALTLLNNVGDKSEESYKWQR